jgi:hypothetical protein
MTADQDHLDLLWGAEAIAKALNLKNRRQAFHLLEGGKIPATKIGSQWVASRKKLKKHFGLDDSEVAA